MSAMEFDPSRDYPLGSRRPELVTTPSGLHPDDVTLAALREGRLDPDDVRATAETIRRQAAVALAAGRTQLADNLMRAAELATVPAEVVLDAYTALRPHRSTAAELEALAARLESDYAAPRTGAFVREALAVYTQRGFLAVDERTPAQV
jgi:propanediol dehydratase small subunit